MGATAYNYLQDLVPVKGVQIQVLSSALVTTQALTSIGVSAFLVFWPYPQA